MDGKTKTVRKFTECNLTGMRSKGRRNIDGETKSGEMDISRQGPKSCHNRNIEQYLTSVYRLTVSCERNDKRSRYETARN